MIIPAPAKINLFLHVTGQRGDGYHDICSLMAFTDFGDVLAIGPATSSQYELDVTGPFSNVLDPVAPNLVTAAFNAMSAKNADVEPPLIMLEKQIPIAAGLGGGSADAAATLRGLNQFWNSNFDTANLREIGMQLGADVPACIESRPVIASGIGEIMSPAPSFPEIPLLLVNPGVAISTPEVFGALKADFQKSLPDTPGKFGSLEAMAEYLKSCRNDLQAPAIAIAPIIAEVAARVGKQRDCLLSRMTGSGATVFGIFSTSDAVAEAASAIRINYPEWWVQETLIRANA